jgi:hypothetical protein
MASADIPLRASDAGPESQQPRDAYDWLYEAEELAALARRIPKLSGDTPEERNEAKIAVIEKGIAAFQEAKELLLCR